MKIKLSGILLLFFILRPLPALSQVDRVEPPSWWAGMKNSELQLLVHGKDVAHTEVAFQYKGLRLESVSRVENPNYLFINLILSKEIKPGSFDLLFKKGKKTIGKYHYEIKVREENSAAREGFNNADVIYLAMPDRFSNGDPANDEVKGMKEGLNRKDPFGRHGGDLKGIMDHLDYIKNIGFTALWLNPVLENNQPRQSYHGYAITDFYKVDPRLGTNNLYRELGKRAREKGIKMIMDMVFNHCGSEHWWMKDLPTSDWINSYPDTVFTNHRRTINEDPHASKADAERMTDGWFVPTMPDLNQRNPFLANYLIQNSIWWIENAHLAGIRMDTYPYPDKSMMAEWNRRVLEEFPDFNIVGEEWTMQPGIISYWQRGQKNSDGYQGDLPSLMDFPIQNALVKSLTEPEGWNTGLIKLYDALAMDFLYPDPDNLVVFPDNHDMSRFYMQVGMDPDLFRLGITYILTTRGIPQIFYGTEILMTHEGSTSHGDIRKDFPGGWQGDTKNVFTGKGLSHEVLNMQNFFRKLLNWRKDNPVIHTGKLIHFAPENGIYVYFRLNKDKKVMVILNKNRKPSTLRTDRFKQVIGESMKGTDIITGRYFSLQKEIQLQPVRPLILELNN